MFWGGNGAGWWVVERNLCSNHTIVSLHNNNETGQQGKVVIVRSNCSLRSPNGNYFAFLGSNFIYIEHFRDGNRTSSSNSLPSFQPDEMIIL